MGGASLGAGECVDAVAVFVGGIGPNALHHHNASANALKHLQMQHDSAAMVDQPHLLISNQTQFLRVERVHLHHRTAFAFGVLGLVVPGVRLRGADAVAKSAPGFLARLAAVAGG